jgi:hypothetical protein
MTEDEAISKSRQYFLSEDNTYGCAETAYLVLQEAFGLPNPADSSPAMAFNGGFAWTGGMCGVIAGSAIAIGQLAASRIEDHKRAKRITRMIFIRLMDELIVAKRPLNCRDIIGRDIWSEEQHSTFIDSGIWRDVCMSQIEYLIHRLYRLTDLRAWEQEVASLEEEN